MITLMFSTLYENKRNKNNLKKEQEHLVEETYEENLDRMLRINLS